jgi:hypothetical protein
MLLKHKIPVTILQQNETGTVLTLPKYES